MCVYDSYDSHTHLEKEVAVLVVNVIVASSIPRQVACSERGALGFASSYGVDRLVWGDPEGIRWETG